MKLLLNLVRKDFKRNRVITTALAVFLILSAIFMAGGLRVTGIMLSSLNGLNKMAVPPEYVQMHKGDYDEQAVADFVAQQDYLEDALVVRMLDVNNAQIICNGESLEKCLMDNGFGGTQMQMERECGNILDICLFLLPDSGSHEYEQHH